MFIDVFVLCVTSYHFNLKELKSHEQSTGQQEGKQKETDQNHKRKKDRQKKQKRREERPCRFVKRHFDDLQEGWY
jgi:hypothetical protein